MQVINENSYHEGVKYYFLRYINEVLESLIAYSIYSIINEGSRINVNKIIGMSMIIGLITLVLEEYNPIYKNTIKSGILMTIGSTLLKEA